MFWGRFDNPGFSVLPDSRTTTAVFSVLTPILFGLVSLGASYVILGRFGPEIFAIFLVGLFFGSIFAYISFRSLVVPLLVWVLAIGGLRYLYSIQAPILPDLYLDRMVLLWLLIFFMVKFVVVRRPLKGPWTFDLLLVLHAGYLFIHIYLNGMHAFHIWTVSTVTPYLAYFFTKNIVNDQRKVNFVLGALMVLAVYYNIDAVAEKFNITALIWPKEILSAKNEFAGRSLGPFLHAPVFGTIIGMLLPLHFYFLAQTRNIFVKALLYLSFAVGFAGLYFTYTRGSWLAGLAALGVASFMNREKYLRILMPVVVILPVVAVLFLGLAQDQFMKKRLENEETVGFRLATAIIVGRMWQEHPLTGVGFFQYRWEKLNYTDPIDLPIIGTVDSHTLRASVIHDIYIGPTAETGLIGAVLQFLIYFLVLRRLWCHWRGPNGNGHFARLVVPLLAGLMAGYFVGGLAIDYRYFSIFGTFFFFAAGILDGYGNRGTQDVEVV